MGVQAMSESVELEITLPVATLNWLLNLIFSINDEARLKISREGLEVKQVDPGNVSLCQINIKPSEFVIWKIPQKFNKEDGMFLPIEADIAYMREIIKKFDQDDICRIRQIEQASGHVTDLTIGGRCFVLPSEISCRAEPKIPELNLPVKATLDLSEFAKDIRFCELVSDYLILSYAHKQGKYGEISIEIEGDRGTKFTSVYKVPKQTKIASRKGRISSLFNIDYLLGIIRAMKSMKYKQKGVLICQDITLSFGSDFPLLLEGNITENFYFKFMIAPRIESD
jgi:proliferating cell nuclear antigen